MDFSGRWAIIYLYNEQNSLLCGGGSGSARGPGRRVRQTPGLSHACGLSLREFLTGFVLSPLLSLSSSQRSSSTFFVFSTRTSMVEGRSPSPSRPSRYVGLELVPGSGLVEVQTHAVPCWGHTAWPWGVTYWGLHCCCALI